MATMKRCLTSVGGPKAVGPYSMACEAGGIVFCAGQIPIDPASGDIVGETVAEQTRRALDNLRLLLEENGLGLSKVVKTTCFLTDLGTFAEFNAVYAEYFPEQPPARSTIGVAALPKGAKVEVEAVALRGD
jgi:2-iminobutanoate/2-iminopropanoate deaminase